tara:strand:- start:16122 stop:16496 length:375 start_codon:yes stop_codon:yes gene_type:complete
MSTINTGAKRDQITELEGLSRNLYENIFNVTLVNNSDKSFYAYNLLNKVIFPESLNSEFIEEVTLTSDQPWTMLSFELYGTIQLWWVVYLLNKPDYIFKAKAGTTYKYIKSKYITSVLQQITTS